MITTSTVPPRRETATGWVPSRARSWPTGCHACHAVPGARPLATMRPSTPLVTRFSCPGPDLTISTSDVARSLPTGCQVAAVSPSVPAVATVV